MKRLILSTCILAPPLLMALGWWANSTTELHCSNLQTRSFCQATRDGAVAVSFWGDSITRGQSQIDYPNSWAGLTERFIRTELPEETKVSFANLSVDGASVGNMREDDQPIVDGLPWSEAIEKSAPNLLFIAIGMNSTGDPFHFGQILQERVRFAKSWKSPPTIVLVTPIVPIDDPNSPASPPEWVDADAMQVRVIAAEEGVLLVDANAAHHFWTEAAEDPSVFLSNGATGNAINHPSDVGHHRLLYTPVTHMLQRVIHGFD